MEAIILPENATKLGEAKDNAGNDMLKMMQFVFPIIMQIEMDVIKNYGFSEGREGTVKKSRTMKSCVLNCFRSMHSLEKNHVSGS